MADPKSPPAGADWRQLHLWQIQPVRDVLMVAAAAGVLWLGYKISLVTVPILLALLLAYLFEPLVRALTRRRHFSRPGIAIAIIIAAFFVVIVPVTLGIGTAAVQGVRVARGVAETSANFLSVMRFSRQALATGDTYGKISLVNAPGQRPNMVPEFTAEPTNDEAKKAAAKARSAFENLPRSMKTLSVEMIEYDQAAKRSAAEEVADAESTSPTPSPAAVRYPINRSDDFYALVDSGLSWLQDNASAVGAMLGRRALGSGAEAIGAAVRTLQSIGGMILMLFLTAFFFYFFSTGYGKVLAFWERLIPERKKGRVIELVQRMDTVIAGFVRGRLTIALCLMLLYTVGYWFIGVPAPLLLGPIIGALAIIPFVSTIAIPLAMILMALQPSSWEWQQAWWWILLGPVLVYGAERILDDYILTPLIQGKHTDMGMPAILFASLAGGVLAGVYGLLIAIPVAACIKILLNEIFWPRFEAWAEGREPDFLPIGDRLETEVLIKRK